MIEQPTFDPLAAFANWFTVQQGYRVPPCPFDAVTRVGKFTGLILYHEAPYQVQLWICEPNAEIPEHSHPNMDTIFAYLSGQIYLNVNGQSVLNQENTYELPDGQSSKVGAFARIGPKDKHSAKIGPKGGSFLNFGLFHDGFVRSAHLDWEGEPLGGFNALNYIHPLELLTKEQVDAISDGTLYPTIKSLRDIHQLAHDSPT